MDQDQILTIFEQETAAWFAQALGEPTPVQKEAWPLIAAGKHVLVSAPTGTGKTLSAFLVFLDRLKRRMREGTLKQELYLIYVSPLKSLAADIRENLRRPLQGIGAEDGITVGIRTGDTPQPQRQRMVRKPPHILIITPESLYLMLTAKTGQHVLATARAVILDELHALIDTKRGAHLMLSLARLDHLCVRPLQRIGLSATIEPLGAAAEYLAPEGAAVAAPVMEKKVRLDVLGPYADLWKGRRKDPVWEKLGALVFSYCQGSRSVIAFVEGRRYAEKLAYYVNLIGGDGFARVHHGSLSKERRMETELALRNGTLRLLCATSSMELGIDVGEIDQVLQVGCPRTVSGTMQRLGRAGHNPGRVSVMYLFPRTAAECVSCGMTAQLARQGGVEQVHPPSGCLDVLAQHLVSMAAWRSYSLDEVMEILPRAWPFRNVSKADVKAVLGMLAGDYEHHQDIPARPRVLYDRLHETVEGDGYSRMLAVSAGGTIPDKGLYAVKTQDGVKVGEVDEEFVYESQKGDRFILGSFAWRVVQIGRDTVTVEQAPVEGARLPFWKGEIKGRDRRTGIAFGRMFHSLQEAYTSGTLTGALQALGLDEAACSLAGGYLTRQIQAVGGLADDRTIVAEHFRDASGSSQLMIHSVFGRRIHAPLALLAAETLRGQLGLEVGFVDEEDGFLLYAYGDRPLPEDVLYQIDPDTCMRRLEILLPATPLFNIAFRYNSGRALMMGVKKNGRQPLWMQRLRSAQMLEQAVTEKEHPLIRETRRECMHDLWDAAGVQKLLEDLRAGFVTVREVYPDLPSPMSLPLQWEQEAAVMYDYAPTPRGIYAAVEASQKAFEKALEQENGLHPGRQELLQAEGRDRTLRLPQNEKQLHSLLMAEGDLAAGELDLPVEWLKRLAQEGRVCYLEQGLWIAAEHREAYAAALDAGLMDETAANERLHIVRRMLRYRGAADARQVAARYGWTDALAHEILQKLCLQKEAVEQDGRYYHMQAYRRASVQTLKNRREEIQTAQPQAYAAFLFSRMQSSAPPEECVRSTLERLAGLFLPASYWEEIVLSARIKRYQERMLDAFLTEGVLFWHMDEQGGLRFDAQEAVDWEAAVEEVPAAECSEEEQILYGALAKRGASFMQALNGLLAARSPYDTLLSLMGKGLVYADSFVPVRQYLVLEKAKKTSAKQLAAMRVKALRAGRWEIVRPLRACSQTEQLLEQCRKRFGVLTKETTSACGISWQEALSVLRIWEYTGQARRGYFVRGMSGAQFIYAKDYPALVRFLQKPEKTLVWVHAQDPEQPWGKVLPHLPGRNFQQLAGTAVACLGGLPVAVMERHGKIFRLLADEKAEPNEQKKQEVLDLEKITECLKLFAEYFKDGRLFYTRRRITVKEYPDWIKEAFSRAGFLKEMNDFSLYR